MNTLFKYILFFTGMLISFPAFSQNITGHVHFMEGEKAKSLPGAHIRWINTQIGTVTDGEGNFVLEKPTDDLETLVVSAVGYENDTIALDGRNKLEIMMNNPLEMQAVVVTKEQKSTFISKLNVTQQEVIGQKELLRAACCNLSESFETNPSVDVNFSDAISGAKQIRLLGLQGIYSQLMFENMPGLRGLAAPYGLSYVPGTWISSIQITKGAGSVVNGYESMAGQINIELVKPHDADKLYLNYYTDMNSRNEFNGIFNKRFNERLGTTLLTHASGLFLKMDKNDDNFLDNPLGHQINLMNRWDYFINDRLETQFGVKALLDKKIGGQMDYNESKDKGTTNHYGVGINTNRYEAFAKFGVVFPSKPYKSIGSQYSFTYHNQESYYGLRNYDGNEKTGYVNLLYNSIIGNTNHKFKVGTSFLYDDYKEKFMDTAMNRTEIVPGVFGEYNYSYHEHLSLQLGLRADQHNLYGLMLSPRVHLRYAPIENTVLRASVGKSYRTANIWVENASLWASSKNIVILENPEQESSWNYGGSLLQDFKVFDKEMSINADYYFTQFENQVIADIDSKPGSVLISNLHGKSYASSFQTGINYEPIKHLKVLVAYKYQDVKVTYADQLLEKPLTPKERMLLTLSYSTKFDKWMFDFTTVRYGKSRLPKLANETRQDFEFSPAYFLINTQVTKNFKKWSLYVGSENLLDYKQINPIVSAEDPFGPNFDASRIWGPIEGRRIYLGLRYKIKQ